MSVKEVTAELAAILFSSFQSQKGFRAQLVFLTQIVSPKINEDSLKKGYVNLPLSAADV